MAELIIQSGKQQGRKLRVAERDIVIGREDDCQVRLTSSDVSEHHCVVRATAEGLLVNDLGSASGTWVNDVRIEAETTLKPGDTLRVGNMLFQVPTVKKAAKPAGAGGTSRKTDSAGDPLSDDDIAGWLSDASSATPAAPGDTKVIRAKAAESSTQKRPAAAAAPQSKPAGASAADTAPKRVTVADEAADIIRRWWQVQKSQADES